MNDLKFTNQLLPIILAISGASGTLYGIRILQFLLESGYKVEFVISESALKVIQNELGLNFSLNPKLLREQVLSYLKISSVKNDSFTIWAHDDIAASISSGSYKTLGMIIAPCSMGTIGAIASGASDNLITRAADVCLKERRKLVIVPREMPFSTIHLENLLKLSSNGAVITPASPAFYHNPRTISDIVDFVAGKVLDVFGIDHNIFKRWKKEAELSDVMLKN